MKEEIFGRFLTYKLTFDSWQCIDAFVVFSYLFGVILAFARFWEAGRTGIRRVRALGVLDPELGDALDARNQRRREVVRAVVKRLAERYGRPAPDERAQVEEMLYTLTSFETFDTLAGPKRGLEEVAPAILQLARAATGLSPQA